VQLHDGARVVEELLNIGRAEASRDAHENVVLFDRARAGSPTAPRLAGDHHEGLARAPPSASGGTDVSAAV
jgi:hypothetical protein